MKTNYLYETSCKTCWYSCGIQGILHGSFISWWASGKTHLTQVSDLLQWGINNSHLMTENVSSQEIILGLVGLVPGFLLAWKFDLLKLKKS